MFVNVSGDVSLIVIIGNLLENEVRLALVVDVFCTLLVVVGDDNDDLVVADDDSDDDVGFNEKEPVDVGLNMVFCDVDWLGVVFVIILDDIDCLTIVVVVIVIVVVVG